MCYVDFEKLYSAITKDLDVFREEALSKKEINQIESDWFKAIVQGFTNEYNKWPTTNEAHIRKYLDLYNNTSSRILRVSSHAFLHVAYDLPRVLADNMNIKGTNRIRLRNLFLRPTPLFRQTFSRHVKDGGLGFIFRPFGATPPVEMLAYWVIALRSVAWIHAEILADNPRSRKHYEANLAQALFKAGDEAYGKFWIFGIPHMEVSKLFQVAPVQLIQEKMTFLLLGVIIILIGGGWIRTNNLTARLNVFGENVYRETTKNILKGIDDPESKNYINKPKPKLNL